MDEKKIAQLEQGYRGWSDWRSLLIVALIEDWRRQKARVAELEKWQAPPACLTRTRDYPGDRNG